MQIDGRWVEFGLAKGSGDLIGIHRRLITPEMVGTYIGQFFSCEIKTDKGAVRKEQIIWQETIRRFGGNSEIWRNEKQAADFIAGTGFSNGD